MDFTRSKARARACEAITGRLAIFLPHHSFPTVQLFTDGACSGNPGPGGWAFILRHPATGKEMESSGGEALSTNNKMELTAAVRGLEASSAAAMSSC